MPVAVIKKIDNIEPIEDAEFLEKVVIEG